MATVSVGILTYNRKEAVVKAIQSAYDQDVDGLEVVVVDSASTDGTAEVISERFPEVKLIRLPRNLGCPGGRNHVLVNCTGEYIVSVDDDGFLGEGSVQRVIDTFESDPSIGIVALHRRYTDEPHTVREVGGEPKEVSNFSGGVSAFRRAMLDRTGYYPEDFFLFAEEPYLAIQAMDAGYRIISAPEIIMWHPRVGFSADTRWDYYRFRNTMLVVIRLFPGWLMVKYLVLRIVSHAIHSLRRRTPHKYLRAVGHILWHLPRTLLTRRPCTAEAVRKYFQLRRTVPQYVACRPGESRVSDQKRHVIVFQRLLPHYRMGVFETIASSTVYDYTFCFGQTQDRSSLHVVSKELKFSARFAPIWQWRMPGMKNALYFQRAEIRAALNREFDVLIFSSDLHIMSFVLASMLARLRRKKVIHWGLGLPTGAPRRDFKWWARRQVMRLANVVLLYGQREYEAYVRLGVSSRNVFLAYNALDTRPARTLRASIDDKELRQFRRDHGLDGRRVLIYTGRLIARKKLHELVAAMPIILGEIPEAKLVLIGDGPEAPRLATQLKDMGLTDAVSIPGGIHDEALLARYYLCSDLAVCPGQVGLMVNHAFVYGVPVLTNDDLWNHGPEIAKLEPDFTGALFKAGNVASLAEHAIELLQDREKLDAMRRRCSRLIDDRYNEQVMAKCFDDAVRYALDH